MPASSKHKYSKLLAFPDTYYELIINLLQSVELFCAYEFTDIMMDCSDKEKKHIMQAARYAKQLIHDIKS